jgi:pimeloyl-ACP methyl ester carboxylesterase
MTSLAETARDAPPPPALPEARPMRLRAHGVELHAMAAGPEDGPLVLLLHGFPEFWWAWRRQIAPLAAAGLRVVAPDLRGYNLSERPRGASAYRLSEVSADVLAIADSLGRERVSLVGHDWGAIIAWHLAATRPERLERVAILNGPHPATLRPHLMAHPLQALRLSYFAAFQVPALPEAMLRAGNFAALARAMRATAQPRSFPPSELDHYRAAWARPGALTAMLNWYRAALRHPMRVPRGRIAVPVRIIWGDRDVALDPDLAEAGMALCEEAEVFHLPHATHWLQHDEPEAVNRLLLEFLAA